MTKADVYYKYKSLENFDHFTDIIHNNRLYAAMFTELNDPMEGLFYYFEDEISADIIEKLKTMKQSLRICSLSKNYSCSSMWTHYADNHKGVVIEIGVKEDEDYKIKDITYTQESIHLNKNQDVDIEKAKKLLSKKLKSWEAEEEVRVFKPVSYKIEPTFIDVEIKKIYTGIRMSENYYDLLSCYIEKQNGMREKPIKMQKMSHRDLK